MIHVCWCIYHQLHPLSKVICIGLGRWWWFITIRFQMPLLHDSSCFWYPKSYYFHLAATVCAAQKQRGHLTTLTNDFFICSMRWQWHRYEYHEVVVVVGCWFALRVWAIILLVVEWMYKLSRRGTDRASPWRSTMWGYVVSSYVVHLTRCLDNSGKSRCTPSKTWMLDCFIFILWHV